MSSAPDIGDETSVKVHMHQASPARGWYPDPSHRHTHRWWDGSKWTAHVPSGRRVMTDAGGLGYPAPSAFTDTHRR